MAQKNFDPVLPPLPEELDDDFEEESVKIVRLVKNKEPLVRKNMMTFILFCYFLGFKSTPNNDSSREKPLVTTSIRLMSFDRPGVFPPRFIV